MTDGRSRPCPVCRHALERAGEPVGVEELCARWAPVRFSSGTLEELRRQAEATQLFACPGCGLETFLPPVIGTPGFYRELQERSPGPYYAAEKWEFGEALADARGAGSLVEVGCGPGFFLDRARALVPRVYGIESNELASAEARRRGHAVFAPDEEIAGRTGPVDIVLAFHVLEHVPDPVGFVRGLALLVRPGGRIGLSVPNRDGPVRHVSPCPSDMPPHHATRWRRRSLLALAGRLGLAVERVAAEPLTAPFAYYYSHHWAKRAAGDRPALFRRLSTGVGKALDVSFRALALFGRSSLGLLKGQSLYILMAKRAG